MLQQCHRHRRKRLSFFLSSLFRLNLFFHLVLVTKHNQHTTNILVRGETGRNSLLASTLTRNINPIKYLNNKCNSTLVKQARDCETSKKDNRQTVSSLAQKHENTLTLHIANNEDIWIISKYKFSEAVYEEFNRLWQDQIPLYLMAATYKLCKNRLKFENYLRNIKN